MKNTLSALALFVFGIGYASGALVSDSIKIEFRQSHIDIDRNYKENGVKIDSIFARLHEDSVRSLKGTLQRVEVIGAASPEGSVKFNQYLSENRAKAIFRLFPEYHGSSDSLISFTYLGRDWNGLKKAVETDTSVPHRGDVLKLLNEITNSKSNVEHPLSKLKSIGNGDAYRYLYNKYFPGLRRSTLVVEYGSPIIEIPDFEPLFPVNLIVKPVEPGRILVPQQKKKKSFYMALKTNLIFDAALLPNIGAEFYVGKDLSVTGEWMYGWWDNDSAHDYWRAYGGTLGVRKWFGKAAKDKPLTGQHIGLFGGVVTFDFELGGKGYMGGKPGHSLWDRCCWVAGVEYGYSLPIKRRLNLDFTLGVGYMTGKMVRYVPYKDFYEWKSTRRFNWVGPVKAEISLVWLIGQGNYNRNK